MKILVIIVTASFLHHVQSKIAVLSHDLSMTSEDALDGQPVQFICSASLSVPSSEHTLVWSLNKTRISDGGDRVFVEDQVPDRAEEIKSILTFDTAEWSDTGVIQCNVQENEVSVSTRQRYLAVLAIPVVTINPPMVTLETGNDVEIFCTVVVPLTGHTDALQRPDIVWYEGDRVINSYASKDESGPGQVTLSSVHVATMTVHRVTNDLTYSCTASNKAGTSNKASTKIDIVPRGFSALCPQQTQAGLTWPITAVGNQYTQRCSPADSSSPFLLAVQIKSGLAHRQCTVDGDGQPFWDEVDDSGCVDSGFVNLLAQAQKLDDGIGGGSEEKLQFLSQSLQVLTQSDTTDEDGMRPGNINATLQTIDLLSEVHEQEEEITLTTVEIKAVVTSISNVLSKKNVRAWKTLRKADNDFAAEVIEAIDKYTEILATELHVNQRKSIEADNLILQAESVSEDSLHDVTFPIRDSTASPDWTIKSKDSLTLPKETLQEIANETPEGHLMMSSSYYRSIDDLLPESANETLGSRVLAVTLHNQLTPVKFQNPVIIYFQYAENVTLGKDEPECVYWNFTQGQQGGWSSSGCKLRSYNSSGAFCECNHLTNFAILMSSHRVGGGHFIALSIITMVGCLLSIICLAITMFVYMVLWKQVKSHHTVVLMSLCTAMILANIVFLAGVEQTSPKSLCTTIAIMLHYFYLAVFFIMGVEGFELLLYIVFVFHVRSSRELIMLLVGGWGLPAVVVLITVGITRASGYGNEDFCWLTVENGVIWAFIGPALAIIACNMVILLIVLRRISKSTAINPTAKKKDNWRTSVWNLVVLLPLLGISWIFGLFAINEKTVVFQYIFAIFNSFQGFFVFLFHCAFNKRVREAYREKFKKSETSSSGPTSKALLRTKGERTSTKRTMSTSARTSSENRRSSTESRASRASKQALLSKKDRQQKNGAMELDLRNKNNLHNHD